MRDDFPADVIDLLASRVGVKCSNPSCLQPTSGPRTDPNKAINVGVAAHITAASKGGPRYDPALSSPERKSPENGIWLCQNCAKLIDNDAIRYSVDLLKKWKSLSEEIALLAIEQPKGKIDILASDADMIRFFAQCFDRPAFQDTFYEERSMEAFDKAFEDTITAINTGCLRSRDGTILSQSKGKAFLKNIEWRRQMDTIVDMLRAVRSRYDNARREGVIRVTKDSNGSEQCYINDRSIVEWIDGTREQILHVFGEVCQAAGVPPLHIPRPQHRHR